MIQFNLLPDIKLEYIRTKRRERLITFLSLGVIVLSSVIFVILFLTVRVVQQKSLSDLDKDIKVSTANLEKKTDLDKVLTIQNQLDSLPGLHEKKVVSSRLYDFLTRLTPNKANISQVDVNFEENTINIKGAADSVETINKFVDTVKFTQYGPADDLQRAFSNVVLESFLVASAGKDAKDNKTTTYAINFEFDPAIFALSDADISSQDLNLTVPKIISTRSEIEKPETLFVPAPIENDFKLPEEGL